MNPSFDLMAHFSRGAMQLDCICACVGAFHKPTLAVDPIIAITFHCASSGAQRIAMLGLRSPLGWLRLGFALQLLR